MAYNHPINSERDRITGYFLPENVDARERLSREELDNYAAKLFGTENIIKTVTVQGNPEEKPDQFLHYKESDFYQVNYRYSRIFDLCRVIGAVNLYDIGCQSLNQSIQLVQYSRMSYTGIMNGRFLINDYRPSDFETKNYNIIKADETPPPLCDGRIRYIRGHYPEFELDVLPNNIAIACYSLTMYHEEEEIRKMVEALTRDFDRILFNIRFRDSNVVEWTQRIFHSLCHNILADICIKQYSDRYAAVCIFCFTNPVVRTSCTSTPADFIVNTVIRIEHFFVIINKRANP